MDDTPQLPRRYTDRSTISDQEIRVMRGMVTRHARWFREMGVPDMSRSQRELFPSIVTDAEITVRHKIAVERSTQVRIGLFCGIMSGLAGLLTSGNLGHVWSVIQHIV